MNEIGTFDILGPNMIGPSSSHTAGALRIAFVAGRMVERAASVKFVLYGSFARTYHGHGTDRALVGGILGYHPDDERIRDSFEHAKEAGLAFSFEENFTDKEIYPNTVDIYVTDKDGSVVSLRGKSIGGGNAVITRLNGVDVELTGNYCTLVVEHVDKKGTLAFVTTVLSAYDLNIGSLRLYRESKGKRAYAIIEVDTNVSNQVVSALKGVESVTNVLVVPAIQLD
ncbi:l-serine ammonia-lyase [Clostridium sp. CAG:58]|uniref:L-serine ammonia-lyase, iron-sulfur-dependent subunit beta n=1 Tax=Alitiscatomonas sp. TaxID=2981647 RepID=UPI0003399B08|nr:l-serine ammonia-lyase [Clostridium sp. CAG:58]